MGLPGMNDLRRGARARNCWRRCNGIEGIGDSVELEQQLREGERRTHGDGAADHVPVFISTLST
jgi:hypothetical protein